MVGEFKDALLEFPKRVPAELRRQPLPEILEAVRNGPEYETVSIPTIKKSLTALSSVFKWARSNGYREDNPAEGVAIATARVGRSGRKPFSSDDLRAIFEKSPVFASGARQRGGGGEAAFWLPLLGLFTGARLEELGQALVSDVRTEAGIAYLDINSEDTKRLKNRSSERKVPLHQQLREVGFLRYVDSVRKSGEQSLFPDLIVNKNGNHTAQWSKWLGRYLRDSVGIRDEGKVFHSFRHTFKDACRAAGISEEVHDALTGHTSKGVGRMYGAGVPLSIKAEEIQRVGLLPVSWTRR